MPKIIVFDAKPYLIAEFKRQNTNNFFDITFVEEHLKMNNISLTKGFEAVCVFVNDYITRDIVKELKKNEVKIISLMSAGYNHIDINSTQEFGIPVVRVPAYSPNAVAEHTLALIMTLNRKIHKAYCRTREGNFSLNGLLGFDMCGKTIGVIGTGRIGKILIEIIKGFGMNVLCCDKYPDEEFAKLNNATYVEKEELFAKSDIISLNCPLMESTKHIINSKSIEKMKKGVMIINTGRGGLINSEDLIEGLKSSQIGYAGLDVYEEESEYFFEDCSDCIIQDDMLMRLLAFPNVIITSHQAFFTKEALGNIISTNLDNINKFINGRELQNVVSN